VEAPHDLIDSSCELVNVPGTTASREGTGEYSDSQVCTQTTPSPPRRSLTMDELDQGCCNENSSVSGQDSNSHVAKSGRSPLSELLVYPSSNNRKRSGTKNFSARVLTSTESIALLEEKNQKKIEEKEEKERKKKEREMKKIAREQEKQRKALERETKKAATGKTKKGSTTRKRSGVTTSTSKRQHVTTDDTEEEGLQHREISQYECAACFGHWEEDDADEWMQCTNSACGVWSHADCLEKSENTYMCVLCQTFFT